jgi:Histidine kinase
LPQLLPRSSHSILLANKHDQTNAINHFQNNLIVKLPEKVQMAVEVLGKHSIRKASVAPFIYRRYLRWRPDTPPPLWGATESFWTAYAFAIAMTLGTVAMIAFHGLIAFGTKEILFLNIPLRMDGLGVLIAHLIVWPVVGLIGTAMATAEEDSKAREATLLGLPPWKDFSATWHPSLLELERQVTPQEFRLLMVWRDARTIRFVCMGVFIFAALWLMLPQIVLSFARVVTLCYVLFATQAMAGKAKGTWFVKTLLRWTLVHGILFGLSIAAAVAACYYGFVNGFNESAIQWTLVMAVVMMGMHVSEWALFRRQRTVSQQVQRAEQARQLADARLHALKAQIEPHFVFNTIAHLRSLIATEPKNAERMADELSDFLRASLHALREDSTTVEAEMVLCRAYLEIARLRFGERLSIAIDVASDAESIKIPPLMLLTLLENAIQHGVEPKETPSCVTVSAAVSESNAAQALLLTVTDDGVGFGGNAVGGVGVGLANVRERLASTYGEAATLTLTANQPSGVRAQIRIPLTMAKS